MKKFIQNSSLFILIILCINIILFAATERLYIGNYKEVDLTFNTFLLADSHGLSLEDSTEEFGVYNFSAGSDSYFDMHRKIKFLIHNRSVKTIVLTVDDHTLSPYRENTNNLDRSNYFTTIDDFESNYTYFKEKHIKYYIPFFNAKSRSIIRSFVISQIKKGLKLNQDKKWEVLNDSEKIEKSKNRASEQFPDETPSKLLKESLEEIIQTCNTNSIELIGIKFPLVKEYNEIIENKSYRADSIFYKNKLTVFNFVNAFDEYNNEYFANQDHLNTLGGIKYSEILRDSILK